MIFWESLTRNLGQNRPIVPPLTLRDHRWNAANSSRKKSSGSSWNGILVKSPKIRVKFRGAFTERPGSGGCPDSFSKVFSESQKSQKTFWRLFPDPPNLAFFWKKQGFKNPQKCKGLPLFAEPLKPLGGPERKNARKSDENRKTKKFTFQGSRKKQGLEGQGFAVLKRGYDPINSRSAVLIHYLWKISCEFPSGKKVFRETLHVVFC